MDININSPYVRSAVNFEWIWNNEEKSVSYDSRLFYVISGNGTALADNFEYKLYAGSLLIFKAGTKYHLENNCNEQMRIMCICFDFNQKRNNVKEPLSISDEHNFRKSNILNSAYDPIFENPVCLGKMQSQAQYLNDIVFEIKRRFPYYEGKCSALLKTVFINCARSLVIKTDDNGSFDSSTFFDYIQKNYMKDINNSTVAQHFGYHPYYLSKLIKTLSGITLHQYLLDYRLNEAKQLLHTTKLSIEEISGATGFKNPSHFSSIFKDKYGECPSDFRKRPIY